MSYNFKSMTDDVLVHKVREDDVVVEKSHYTEDVHETPEAGVSVLRSRNSYI